MNAWEHWQVQRDVLRQRLAGTDTLSEVVVQVRHALSQTEQNTLAELGDDLLRQQAGILFTCLKSSVGLLETPAVSQVWVPRKADAKAWQRPSLPGLAAAALLVPLLLFFYMKAQWLGMALGMASLLCALGSAFRRPAPAIAQDETRVTLRPDLDRLLAHLDEQLRLLDRQLRDLDCLNDQLRGDPQCADEATLARAADLMEAICDWEPDERSHAEEAANHLLYSLGLCSLPYSEENRPYFNTLPSKTETRTLSPAILSVKDHRLIRRGTAAVRMDAA